MFLQANPFTVSQTVHKDKHRPLPKSPVAKRHLAERLAMTPNLNQEQRNTLVALGHLSFRPLFRLCQTAKGDRLEEVQSLIAAIAVPKDTKAIWALLEPLSRPIDANPFETAGDGSRLATWLQHQGEPNLVGRIYLPQFQKANFSSKQSLLPFLKRSTEGPVIDAQFAILKNPQGDPYLRSQIYRTIAHCGRSDVLQWLLANRSRSRRLSTPNPKKSPDLDTDHDGISDALDVNPYAAPRSLSETEKVLQTALESQLHFSGPNAVPAYVTFPKGIHPFEVYGWDGPVVPANLEPPPHVEPETGDVLRRLPFVTIDWSSHSSGPVVRFSNRNRTATVDLSMVFGPLAGGSTRITLRKFGNDWFSVDEEITWLA